ncbi:MAG: hypothetical protein ACYCOU_06810 [Sulfobacillus sp.]
MIPVDMLWVHDPENGIVGDCFRACIASILELPAVSVPHFGAIDYASDNTTNQTFEYLRELHDWLRPRGLAYMTQVWHGNPPEYFREIEPFGFDCYHILSGMSHRGFMHAVVARNGLIVHDPHPSRAGLSEPSEDGYIYGFFVLGARK